jgi:hypothetical protein
MTAQKGLLHRLPVEMGTVPTWAPVLGPPTAYCQLPTAHCLPAHLPICLLTHCPLPTAHCRLAKGGAPPLLIWTAFGSCLS